MKKAEREWWEGFIVAILIVLVLFFVGSCTVKMEKANTERENTCRTQLNDTEIWFKFSERKPDLCCHYIETHKGIKEKCAIYGN